MEDEPGLGDGGALFVMLIQDSCGAQRAAESGRAARAPRIALFGIFGVQNIGNECTLQAMLYNVRARMGEADVYTISYEPADTRSRHGVNAVPVSFQPAGAPTARRHSKPVRLLRGAFRRVPMEVLDWMRAVRTLRNTDLLVMTGTGMLTDYSTSCLGYPLTVLKWTTAAALAGCKVRFAGIGVGPIYERLSRTFIRFALKLADYRSFRDSLSQRRLQAVGFHRESDRVYPDLAFSLPRGLFAGVHDKARSDGHLVIGLGVMNHVDRHTCRPEEAAERYERYLTGMCNFVAWLHEHGYHIRILQGDLKHDLAVRRALRARLQQRGFRYDGIHLVDDDISSVEDLISQLAQVDVVVSPRFHNLILALMSGRPVISLSYDPKSDALLDGFGLGEYCQGIGDIDVEKLSAQLLELERHRRDVEPVIRERVELYRTQLETQYQEIFGKI